MNDRILYHYCDTSTFLNIIKKKQLWMTDISKSNDYDEMRILLPDIFDYIVNAYERTPFVFNYVGKKGLDAIKQVVDDTERLINKAFERGRTTSFVVCFSEYGDSLGQWRGYGDDGNGISIGFSLRDLQNYCEQRYEQIYIKPVKYINISKRKNILQDKAINILNTIEKLEKNPKELYRNIESIELNGSITNFM